MVAGGVIIRPDKCAEVEARIQEIKDSERIGTMKWSKYSRYYEDRRAAKALLNLFVGLQRNNYTDFHSIVVHFATFNHKRFDRVRPAGKQTGQLALDLPKTPSLRGSPEKSAGKMLYQLILHRLCRYYGQQYRLHIYPDQGDDSAHLLPFRGALCAEAMKRYGALPNCVSHIEPLNSRSSNILQMVDVIIGGMAAHRNERITTAHKHSLAKNILIKNKFRNWERSTPEEARVFTVWVFDHTKSKRTG
jgi:hypothetical protein